MAVVPIVEKVATAAVVIDVMIEEREEQNEENLGDGSASSNMRRDSHE
jgi:hypothetical protein